jgi:hypothetical protein
VGTHTNTHMFQVALQLASGQIRRDNHLPPRRRPCCMANIGHFKRLSRLHSVFRLECKFIRFIYLFIIESKLLDGSICRIGSSIRCLFVGENIAICINACLPYHDHRICGQHTSHYTSCHRYDDLQGASPLEVTVSSFLTKRHSVVHPFCHNIAMFPTLDS